MTTNDITSQMEAIRGRDVERVEKPLVGDLIERGVRADAEGQRQDCDDREARVADQLPST